MKLINTMSQVTNEIRTFQSFVKFEKATATFWAM